MSFFTSVSSQSCLSSMSYGKPLQSAPSLNKVSRSQTSIQPASKPLSSRPISSLRAITTPSFRSPALPTDASPSVEDISKTLVQEIVRSGEGVPDKYLIEAGITPAVDEPEVWQEKLLLDLSLLSSNDTSSPSVIQELAKLRSALSEWGCFQIVNHGIDTSFLDDLRFLTKQFFSLPLEEKMKYVLPNDIYNGYGNSSLVPGDKQHNWSDRYVLTVYPEDQRNLSVWPTNPAECKGIIHEYSLKLTVLREQVLRAMARCLDLEETVFSNMHGSQGIIITRFAFYPPCTSPDMVYAAHPHSDTTTISILLPDEQAQGLQVLKDNTWVNVPIIPGALYVNVGDFGEVMSNRIFKSVLHRAVPNSERERATVNAFCSPESGNDIEPAKELIDAQHPKLYNMVNAQSYRELFFRLYPQGKRVIDALKI